MVDTSHAAGCPTCGARLHAARQLGTLLASPVEVPPELRSAQFLDRIKASIVDRAESSPLGQLLDREMPVAPPAAIETTFPVDLLDSAVGGDLGKQPARAGEAAWSAMRSRILLQARASRTAHSVRFRVAAAFGVAAAAILCGLLVSEGTKRPPTIVFTDISSVPSMEFSPMAILRHGADH